MSEKTHISTSFINMMYNFTKKLGAFIMNTIEPYIKNYLDFCAYQKRLDQKTLKAYRIDLTQFHIHNLSASIGEINSDIIEKYIVHLNQMYKPKTVKRKIASLKAFFHYLEYKGVISTSPFNKIQIKFRDPLILPKTIPLYTIETLLRTIYNQYNNAKTDYQKKNALRDAAIVELLFSTGIRISELCNLKSIDVDLYEKTILIYGKGSKERRLQIGNDSVANTLEMYKTSFQPEIQQSNFFFVNQNGTPLSDQSVRRLLTKYSSLASIDLHITPHMFRHTFATSLLEADVDIRYIQEMLGHSSINVTEIYTHVTLSKQRDILTTKHPRNNFHL